MVRGNFNETMPKIIAKSIIVHRDFSADATHLISKRGKVCNTFIIACPNALWCGM